LLVGAGFALCAGLMVATLGGDGLDAWDWAILACFLITLPWNLVGFWNAVIGLVLMRSARLRAAALQARCGPRGADHQPHGAPLLHPQRGRRDRGPQPGGHARGPVGQR
jgi:membrane glycosyltransferase